jgi:nicotinate-nucleotide adenylyltransferase
MKIALFGGAFDPPHLGHQQVAQEMIEQKVVDEVWYVPVYKHPWEKRYGKSNMASYEHRKAMLKLIMPKKTQLKEYLDVGFTYPTLVYFSKKHPEHDFSWLMGSEYLGRFDDFLAGHPKLLDFNFYVYPREGFELKTSLKGMSLLVDFPEIAASSTAVKKRLEAGKDVSKLLNESVFEYINKHALYTSIMYNENRD